eukprot:Gb_07720 [translate_table: standard]
MDIKTIFLHGDLKEKIYISQPEGYEVKGKEKLVCRLKKCLYGPKQSPRMWYQKFDTHMLGLEFICINKEDHYIYFKYVRDYFVILLLDVDNILLIVNNKEIIKGVKSQLSSQFKMKDLGETNFILGIKIERDHMNRKLWLKQRKYCPKKKDGIEDMPHVPYARIIESLMYSMVYTRPDIAHIVGVMSRYMSNLGKEHWNIVKRILRYLHGTLDYKIYYQGRPSHKGIVDVQGFINVE